MVRWGVQCERTRVRRVQVVPERARGRSGGGGDDEVMCWAAASGARAGCVWEDETRRDVATGAGGGLKQS